MKHIWSMKTGGPVSILIDELTVREMHMEHERGPVGNWDFMTIVLKHIGGNDIPLVQSVELFAGPTGFAEVTIKALLTAEVLQAILNDLPKAASDAPLEDTD